MNPTQTLIEELKARTAHSARPKATIDKPLMRRAAAELESLQDEINRLNCDIHERSFAPAEMEGKP